MQWECGRRHSYNSLQMHQELSHEHLNLLFLAPEVEIRLPRKCIREDFDLDSTEEFFSNSESSLKMELAPL